MALLDRQRLNEAQQQDLLFDLLLENRAMLSVLIAHHTASQTEEESKRKLAALQAEIADAKKAYLQAAALPILSAEHEAVRLSAAGGKK